MRIPRRLLLRAVPATALGAIALLAVDLRASDSPPVEAVAARAQPRGSASGDGALQDLIHEFRLRRAVMLEERARLIEMLRTATPAERLAILQEFRAAHMQSLATEREVRRELRTRVQEIRRMRRRPTLEGNQ